MRNKFVAVVGCALAFAFSQDITYTIDVRPIPREV